MEYALGRIGLAEAEYIKMTLRQFFWKSDAFEERYQDGWEYAREVVAMVHNANPYKKRAVTREDVVRLGRDMKKARNKMKDYDRLREKAKRIREQWQKK